MKCAALNLTHKTGKKISLYINMSSRNSMKLDIDNKNPIFAPGEIIDYRFKLIKYLGKGSFGEVYHGLDLNLNKKVAIKLQRIKVKQDGSLTTTTSLFSKELITLSRLSMNCKKHVCLYTGGLINREILKKKNIDAFSLFYFVMELIEGISLEDYTPHHILENTDVLLKQLYEGLLTIHKMNIFHSDIKPENIMIETLTGNIKFIDFGLACDSNYEQTCNWGGTPIYMSPEFFSLKGNIITKEDIAINDWFSLGLTISELVLNTNLKDILKKLELVVLNNDILNLIISEVNKTEATSYVKDFIIAALKLDNNDRLLSLEQWRVYYNM